MNNTFSGKFQRLIPEKTYDRIFNADNKIRQYRIEEEKKRGKIRRNNKPYKDSIGKMLEEQGKLSKTQTISEKPCNDNYYILSSEAKKNVTERYYYDNNLKKW